LPCPGRDSESAKAVAAGATARRHVERALRELQRERLDIVHLHGARIQDPFAERAAVFDELQERKAAGKIAHIGLSSHYIAAVRAAIRHSEVEVLYPLVNRAGMGILDGSAEQMAAAIEEAAAAGKGVYPMEALARHSPAATWSPAPAKASSGWVPCRAFTGWRSACSAGRRFSPTRAF